MTSKQKNIIMLGCFDTKAVDFQYLYQKLKEQNVSVTTINVGVMGETDLFPVDFSAESVAKNAHTSIEALRKVGDRNRAISTMGKGTAKLLSELCADKKVDGVIGMGGGGGTFVTLKAMQSVPFGIPKICVSTLAGKDVSEQIGSKDIVLIPSIVDVAGINSISSVVVSQAATAICAMAKIEKINHQKSKGNIAISIFGNTTVCVDKCSELLKADSYDVLTFHAVGTGGKTMEDLIFDDCFDAVLDITTTELADHLCGGICSAGANRMEAASAKGIPQVVVPGCLDMVNFGSMDSVPEKYKNRQLFSWAPDVTLMRTNAEENKILGKRFAEKINKSNGKVMVLLPMGGISKISGKGEVFYQPEIDKILFGAIKKYCDSSIQIIEVDANINTPEFAETAVEELYKLMN